MTEQLTRGEVEDQIARLSKSNPNFRAALLRDPKAALESQGAKIPASIAVKAVEETPTTMYVVVPHVGKAGGELSDDALEQVAGGASKGAQTTSSPHPTISFCKTDKDKVDSY